MPVLEHIDIRKPEACWQERTFVPAHAVVGLIRGITANEAVPHEIPLDRRDGPLHTRIVGWQEAYQGNAQHAGVEHVVIKGADAAVLPCIEALCEHPKIGRASCRERVCQYV